MQLHRSPVLLAVVPALALGGCLSRGPQYVQYPYAQPATAAMAQASGGYTPSAAAAPYQAPAAQPNPTVVTAASAQTPQARGFFSGGGLSFARAPAPGPVYRAPAPAYQAPAPVYQTPAPVYQAPVASCGPQGCGGGGAYAGYPQPSLEFPYLLDAGDRLRITVFGQEGLTNSYAVDAAGNVTLPLIGMIPARGVTTEQLSHSVSERLRQGYIREPKVAIEVEAYRPFFIHGEVGTPGQYAYVANMTVENAIAIAGGFGPRASRGKVTLTRTIGGQTTRASVGLNYPLRPGDTLSIGERWF